MAECTQCKKDMADPKTQTCILVFWETKDREQIFQRIPYGQETRGLRGVFREPVGERCHDCGVVRGGFHHPGCDVEECPVCGMQFIGCTLECVGG